MYFKRTQQKNFREQIDAALAGDSTYREMDARRADIAEEIKDLEKRQTDLQNSLASRMNPADEASAIARGLVPLSAGDPNAARNELATVEQRLNVLRKAIGTVNDELVKARQKMGISVYEGEFRSEQAEAASKVVDTLLDLAAARAEESHRFMDLQRGGITIAGLPRITVRWATASAIEEYLMQQAQSVGYKPTSEQRQRIEGLKRAEAA